MRGFGFIVLGSLVFCCAKRQPHIFVVGGYTDTGHMSGINVYEIDFDRKQVSLLQSVSHVENPSFLTFDSSKTKLFAVSEVKAGKVFAFDVISNTLEYSSSLSIHQEDPCHISYSEQPKRILVSNYTSGSFSKIAFDNNRLELLQTLKLYGKGHDTIRQASPHAHAMYVSPWEKDRIYGVDLGADKIMLYKLAKTLIPMDSLFVDAGSGVRHLAFHPQNRWMYAINELNSTVSLYHVDNHGHISKKSTVSAVIKNTPSFCGEIQIHPNGQKLYASNRGEDTIAVFDINTQTGGLTFSKSYSTEGSWPRFFSLTNDAKHLLVANQKSNNIVVFDLKGNGDIGKSILKFDVNAPSCIVEKQYGI